MLKSILGTSPITSIVGYVIAGATVVQTMLQAGTTDWKQIAIAVAVAILGRVAADANKVS